MPDPIPAAPRPGHVIAIVGPTASGKSQLALELAARLDAEIVNADAMQLYRGMDIGTAKLTPSQRRGVPHHQLDVLDVLDEASVAAYQRHAREDLAAIHARGRTCLLVGGSGLYLRAVLDQLEIPPTDPAVRADLEIKLAAVGTVTLHAQLAALDPAAAERILPGNARRVVRALEVIQITGRPFTASLPSGRYAAPAQQIGLRVPRPELDARIEQRVAQMWLDGLPDEVRQLEAAGLRRGRTASRAVGYAQILEWFAGSCTEVQARQDVVQATRRLARRQESWFNRDPRISWLPASAPGLVDQAEAMIHEAAGVPPGVRSAP